MVSWSRGSETEGGWWVIESHFSVQGTLEVSVCFGVSTSELSNNKEHTILKRGQRRGKRNPKKANERT
jgi:hypothetical protein